MASLLDLDVLAVDCQATAAAPRGHLIELGWAHLGPEPTAARARLIALPPNTRIPPSVARITGISDAMMRDAVAPHEAWRELRADASVLTPQPAPAIAHFARFERPFLGALDGVQRSLDLVCTHEIARRLLPDLPRCTLRALAGYFGGGVGRCRRSADHVTATALVWKELARLLDAEGVTTWRALHEWLATPPSQRRTPGRRVWPMPRDVRLAIPDAPGIYRMLRTSGDVLYVGKAFSLHHRVNSYFRKHHGVPERLLEMLSQARGLSFEIAPSALEAALLETDEIKRLRPPYNIALTDRAEDVVPRNARNLFGAIDGHRDVTPELLRLGTRLWKEGRRGRDGEVDDGPQGEVEQLAIRAALARRRQRWLARLADSAIVWNEAGVERARLLVLHKGEVVLRDDVPRYSRPPIPPGYARTMAERRDGFTTASLDRVRVLLTELKRLVSERSPVAVRLGTARPLEGARLARVFSWI